MKTKRISVSLNEGVYDALMDFCKKSGASSHSIIKQCIYEFIAPRSVTPDQIIVSSATVQQQDGDRMVADGTTTEKEPPTVETVIQTVAKNGAKNGDQIGTHTDVYFDILSDDSFDPAQAYEDAMMEHGDIFEPSIKADKIKRFYDGKLSESSIKAHIKMITSKYSGKDGWYKDLELPTEEDIKESAKAQQQKEVDEMMKRAAAMK